MSISIRVLALAVMIISGVNVTLANSAQTAQVRMRPTAVREIPLKMTRRFSVLHSALRPTARAWVDQMARAETQHGAPNVKALEGAIRKRFPQLTSGGKVAAGNHVDAMVFIVLMQATQDATQDLQGIREQVKAITAAKQNLRSLDSGLRQELERSGAKSNIRCRSPYCRSLRARLTKLSASTSNLPRPVRLQSPAEPTYANLLTLQHSLMSEMESMNEMSEMTSMRLQMAMDRRSKFVETLSNVLKKLSEISSAIVANLK